MTNGVAPFVPHMIAVDKTSLDLRDELNIPKDAIVFGRHGGETTFDLPFVKKLIVEISKKRKDIYFVFMGTNSFVFKSIFTPYKNIIFLPKSQDELYKAKFINTCDAYLHARKQGESFGIAVGEFSICNKPVITWANSDEKSHIDILGDKAILYNDANDLNEIIQNFKVDNSKDWDAYSAEYSAEKVMDKYKSVFID
jgi:glycosyltransferase involved in cell wall biosynthesis